MINLELNIETGEVLFEWSSLDYISPDGKHLDLTGNLMLGS